MRTMLSLIVGLAVVFLSKSVSAQDFEKARQEGRVIFYTSWGPTDADYVIKAFEKKYPVWERTSVSNPHYGTATCAITISSCSKTAWAQPIRNFTRPL